jgi:hypothetical protein
LPLLAEFDGWGSLLGVAAPFEHCGAKVFKFHAVADVTGADVVPMHRVDSIEPHGACGLVGR